MLEHSSLTLRRLIASTIESPIRGDQPVIVSQNARQDRKVWWFIEDKSEKWPKPQHATLPDVMPHSYERAHSYAVPELACIYGRSAYRYSQRNVDPSMISCTLSRSCTRPLGTMTALLCKPTYPTAWAASRIPLLDRHLAGTKLNRYDYAVNLLSKHSSFVRESAVVE